jgi:hypothetical protein
MGQSSKIQCPDCSISLERKNLLKHYRKMHPGLDPDRRIKETRPKKVRKPFKEMPRSTIAGILVSIFVAIVMIVTTLFAFSFFQEAESTPDEPRDVWYTSTDGAIINASFYPSMFEERPTIYLVHDIGDDRTVWDDYARELQDTGYNVLAMDLRGHGESFMNIKDPSIVYDWTTMTPDEAVGIEYDVQGAWRWVTGTNEKGEKNTESSNLGAMVGIGRGGLLGFSQMSRMGREGIWSAVVISPLLDIYERDLFQLFENWGSLRPFLLASSEEDSVGELAMDTVLIPRLEDGETNGEGIVVPGSSRGIRLLRYEELTDRILEIFDKGWELVIE